MAVPWQPTVELDELRLLIVVDNETDTLSSIDEGVPQLPELASLIARVPSIRTFNEHACIPVFEHLCCACHGFSALVTGKRGQEEHSVLFDVGPYADIWLANAQRLAINLATIEAIFLSHWHADHSAGIPRVAAAIAAVRRQVGLSEPVLVDLHPDRPDRRGILLPAGPMILLPEEPTFDAIPLAVASQRTTRPIPCARGSFSGAARLPGKRPMKPGWRGITHFVATRSPPIH